MAINPLKGELKLKNLQINDVNSQQSLSLGEMHIAIDLWQLFQRHLKIERYNIHAAVIPITVSEQGLSLAGIDAKRFSNPDAESSSGDTASENTSFVAAWSAIYLSDIHILYSDLRHRAADETDTPIRLSIPSIQLGAFSTARREQPTSIDVSLELADITFNARGQLAPLTPEMSGSANLDIKNIDLQEIHALTTQLAIDTPALLHSALGVFDYRGDIAWATNDGHIHFNINNSQLVGKSLAISLPGSASESADTVAGEIKLAVANLAVDLARGGLNAKGIHSEDTHLVLTRHAHQPKTSLALNNIYITVDQFDTLEPAIQSSLTLTTDIGKFGKLNASGKTSLANYTASATLAIDAEQINLTDLSGFSFAALNRTIEKGAMDFSFNGQIENREIDSQSDIYLHQLGFGSAPDDARQTPSAFETELGIPLNTALNLLRDKNDSIKLRIPVTGPVDNPDINLNSIVQKAVFKTVKTAVLTQLGPLIAISALDKVKSLNDAMKLKPVYFDKGDTTINEDTRNDLNKLAAFLDKRDKLFVNVCAHSAATELEQNTIDQDKLLALADQRAEAVKQYLIEQSIDGKRLVLCTPGIDTSEEARSRVDFSL